MTAAEGEHDPHGALNGKDEAKKVVGNLACQHDTYLTHLTTRVCDCQKNSAKKALKEEAYEIQLLDTILFPEGGGQPWDHGTLTAKGDDGVSASIPVRKVVRRKLEAIHYVSTAIPVGTSVEVELDFERRFDQAQQHSGQHLLSAVLDTLQVPTLAWSMGPEIVYVEVPRLPDDLAAVEEKCNAHIRENLAITVSQTTERPSNLPDDYDASAGVVRIVSIGGIDANPCCGTHVKSTAELQALSILYTSAIKGANRNNHRIHFVVGKRCRSMLARLHRDVKSTGGSLSCGMGEVPDKVTALQTQLKELMKKEKVMRSELLQHDARDIERQLRSETRSAFLHKPSGDTEYLHGLVSNIPNPTPGICVLVCGGSDGKPGSLIILGDDEDGVKTLSERAKTALPDLKGGGKANKFQGKATAFSAKDISFLASLVA